MVRRGHEPAPPFGPGAGESFVCCIASFGGTLLLYRQAGNSITAPLPPHHAPHSQRPGWRGQRQPASSCSLPTQATAAGAHFKIKPTWKRAGYSQPRAYSRRAGASVGPAPPTWPCRGACRTPSTARTLPWPFRTSQRCDSPPFTADFVAVSPLLRFARRTPGISCEAVPAPDWPERAQGGTSARRTGAALSFVSFIPLLGGVHSTCCKAPWVRSSQSGPPV